MGYIHDATRLEAEHKKRRIDDRKKTTLCFACGKGCHWFKDCRDCQRTIHTKMQKITSRNERAHGEELRGPVFDTGSVASEAYHNPVINSGASRSTDIINSDARMYDFIGARYEIKSPTSVYFHGWGQKCTNAKMIRCNWTRRTVDKHARPV